jgi:hypothetical protein
LALPRNADLTWGFHCRNLFGPAAIRKIALTIGSGAKTGSENYPASGDVLTFSLSAATSVALGNRLPHVLNGHRGKGEEFGRRQTAQSSVWRMSAYLRRAARVARLLSVAACGTLAGHAVTYLLQGRTTDDGHHGYFSPLLAIAIASVLLCGIVAVVRLVTLPRNRAVREASSLTFYATLATLQVAAFAALEFFEGNAPDVIGCGIEALTALVVGAFVLFCISFAERYVAPVLTTYLRRTRNACNAIRRLPANFVQPPLRLAVCAGICRFKRPPPIIG